MNRVATGGRVEPEFPCRARALLSSGRTIQLRAEVVGGTALAGARRRQASGLRHQLAFALVV